MTLKQNLTILMESREKQSFWHTIFFFLLKVGVQMLNVANAIWVVKWCISNFSDFFAYSIEACICKAFSLNLPDADMLV